jgi:hypothetical protein
MNNSFPLYDSLLRDTYNKDLTIKQKKMLVSRIEQIDTNGAEGVYALIKYHAIHTNDENMSSLFNCKTEINTGLSDITWNINNLPTRLRQILFKFTEINETRQQELKTIHESQIKMKNNNDI